MGCEQPSQYQKILVRFDASSVAKNSNLTLAPNKNENIGNTAAIVSGVTPLGVANLYPSTDVDGVGYIETGETVKFVSDANVGYSTRQKATDIDRVVYDANSDGVSQDLKQFLSRPQVVRSGILSSTDTNSTFPLDYSPFSCGVANFKPKLDGYLGFRYTLVLRLVVNATRFQQGRYILWYMPTGGGQPDTMWINDHSATLVQRTTLPHVEIDLACDTEVVMRIPFNSVLNYAPLYNVSLGADVGSLGVFQLTPYSALSAVAGSLTCSYTLYSHFEDVVLVAAAIPNSGRMFTSNVKKRRNETETEQDSANMGPISSALIKVKNVSDLFIKVPLLSDYAIATSWFADLGASAAKIFGFSKPVSLAPSGRITQNYLPYAANLDGPDLSFPLSLSYENQVGMAHGFSGTDVDEMDFTFLSSIPAWINTSSWTTGQTSGTAIAIFGVTPAADAVSTSVFSRTMVHFSPMQIISRHFRYWRGSMVYKFKLVKTEFHSGRIMVMFSPRTQTVFPGNATLAESTSLQRQIIDIRETNEFTIVVPFVCEAPYLDLSDALPTGFLTLMVIDPLIAPATVSQTVTILTERCGGPDIEFAVPRNFPYAYYSDITPQSGSMFASDQAPNVCSNYEGNIGTSTITTDNGLNSLHCVGERISSVRSLLKLPCQIVATGTHTPGNFLHINPFMITAGEIDVATNLNPTFTSDTYSIFAPCYVYNRGGVRLKFLDNVAVTNTQVSAISLFTNIPTDTTVLNNFAGYSAANLSGTTLSSTRAAMPVMYYKPSQSGEVQIPQYGRYRARLAQHMVGTVNRNVTSITSTGSTAPRIYVTKQTIPLSTVDSAILRSGADDLNFGSFLSVPPMSDIGNLA